MKSVNRWRLGARTWKAWCTIELHCFLRRGGISPRQALSISEAGLRDGSLSVAIGVYSYTSECFEPIDQISGEGKGQEYSSHDVSTGKLQTAFEAGLSA